MKTAEETFRRFCADLIEVLGDDLCEVVIHGSYVLGDFRPNLGDLDFIVITYRSLDERTCSRLIDMHGGYRSASQLLLHQLEGAYYPASFLKDLQGQFTGCYIGTNRMKAITALQNSLMDLLLVNERGIGLLGKTCRIYNPEECEILKEQRSDLQAFRQAAIRVNDSDMGFSISLVHWCARTIFYRANHKIVSKTEACRWCAQKPELNGFSSLFKDAETVRSPYRKEILSKNAMNTCNALLDFVWNILSSDMGAVSCSHLQPGGNQFPM